MSRYQLSKDFLSGIDELLKLEEVEFNNVVSVIKQMPAGTGPSTFRKLLGTKVNIPKLDILSAALFGLGNFFATEKKTIENTTEEITTSYWGEKKADDGEDEQLILTSRINIILNHYDQFKTTFKAISLLTENGTLFRESRIITDIRIVFNDPIEADCRNAVILHQLKISTHVNGKSDSVFISLDENDVTKMIETLERAIKKGDKIRTEYKDKFDFITITD